VHGDSRTPPCDLSFRRSSSARRAPRGDQQLVEVRLLLARELLVLGSGARCPGAQELRAVTGSASAAAAKQWRRQPQRREPQRREQQRLRRDKEVGEKLQAT
jgi:hypothetical protein